MKYFNNRERSAIMSLGIGHAVNIWIVPLFRYYYIFEFDILYILFFKLKLPQKKVCLKCYIMFKRYVKIYNRAWKLMYINIRFLVI